MYSILWRSLAGLRLVHAYHVPVPHVEAGASAIIQPLMEGYEENVESEFQVLIKQVPELEELNYSYSVCSKSMHTSIAII